MGSLNLAFKTTVTDCGFLLSCPTVLPPFSDSDPFLSPNFAPGLIEALALEPPVGVGGALFDPTGDRAVGEVVGLGDFDFCSTVGSCFLTRGESGLLFDCCSGEASRYSCWIWDSTGGEAKSSIYLKSF